MEPKRALVALCLLAAVMHATGRQPPLQALSARALRAWTRQHMRLRGGGEGVAPALLGPFMDDESEERALRAELGMGDEPDLGSEDALMVPASAVAPGNSSEAALVDHILAPEYLDAAVERLGAQGANPVSEGGWDGQDTSTAPLLLSLTNGIAVNFKPFHSRGDAEHEGEGGAVGAEEETAVQTGEGARPQDTVKLRLIAHGGAAVLGVDTDPELITAALDTWIGGGAAGHSASTIQGYLRHHHVQLSAWKDPEKCILHLECPAGETSRALEAVHALVMRPNFSSDSLEQAKRAAQERLARLQTMLAARTGASALAHLSLHAPFLNPTPITHVSVVTLEDVRRLVRRLLVGSRLELVLVGNLAPVALRACVRRFVATIQFPSSGDSAWGEDVAGCEGRGLVGWEEQVMDEGGAAGTGVSQGDVLLQMQALRYSLGASRRATTVSVAGGAVAAHVVMVAGCVNRWGRSAEEAADADRFHSAPDWQVIEFTCFRYQVHLC